MIYHGCLMTFCGYRKHPAPWGFCPCCRSGAWLSRDQFKLDVSLLAKLKPLVKFGTLRYCLFFRKHPWKSKEKWSWNIGHVQAVTTIPLDLSLPYRSLGTNGTRNGGRHSSVSFMPINWTTVTHSWIFMEYRVKWHKLFLGIFHCCTAWALPFQHGCPT